MWTVSSPSESFVFYTKSAVFVPLAICGFLANPHSNYTIRGGGGGGQIWFDPGVCCSGGGGRFGLTQGCAARASKPLPIFEGYFGRKGYPLLRIFFFWKIGPFFKNFAIFAVSKTQKIWVQSESWTHV